MAESTPSPLPPSQALGNLGQRGLSVRDHPRGGFARPWLFIFTFCSNHHIRSYRRNQKVHWCSRVSIGKRTQGPLNSHRPHTMVVPINVAHEGHGATSEFSESQILNSLEKMLNLYRERCSSQARQISMLKEQVHELTMSQKHWRGNPEYEPEVVQSPRRRYDQTYIDQLAKELQKMVEENARYRKLLSKAIKKLKKESEWRGAALAFLDSEHDVTVRTC